MIDRNINAHIKKMAEQYPVVTITGPRQSGKTTAAQMIFPYKPYVNFENLSILDKAKSDPIGFLKSYPDGAVIDEVQRVPEIFSYIQLIVDEKQKNGMFILTGSYQFELLKIISQSLSGRTALVTLLPFSINEIEKYNQKYDIDDLIFKGFYPRIYEQKQEPSNALEFYFRTYIERDLRDISKIHNITLFQKFVKMCSGRVGQLLNLSSLASDVGITHTTAREWLTLLEASYVVFLLEPYYANLKKRLVKTPKLYFYDVGLAAHLIGINEKEQIPTHPLRGNLFENIVIMELLKLRYNNGQMNNLNFYRDSRGNEVDIIYNIAQHVLPVEIKSGETVNRDYFRGLNHFSKVIKKLPYGKVIIYGGERFDQEHDVQIMNIFKINYFFKKI